MRWPSLSHRVATMVALRLVAFYVVFSLLWITLTDRILGWLVWDHDLLLNLATYKGAIYVVLMALMLFWMVHSALVDRESAAGVSNPEGQPMALWAPLTIFLVTALLVALIGRYAYHLQGIQGAVPAGALARMAWTGSALGVLFLALAGALLAVWWKREQTRVRAIRAGLEQEKLSLQQQLELLSQYTNDVVLILDEAGHVVGANDRALECYGYTREEMLNVILTDLRAPENRPELSTQMQEVFAKGTLKFETRHRRKDGTIFPVDVSSRRFEQGGKSFLQSVIRDVTERDRARWELQESENRFRAIFEQADLGMVDCSLDGRFVKVNRKFCSFLGYSEAELLGLTFMDVSHPDHREEDRKQVGRMITGERTGYRTMKRYLQKDGTAVWGRTSVTLVRDGEGCPLHFVAATQDINAWRHAEEKLQESEIFVQRILDTTPNLIYIYDLIEKRNVFANRKMFDILGYTQEEVREMGAHLLEKLLHPDDVERVAMHHETIIKARYPEVFEVDYRMKHASGAWRWLHSRDLLFARDKEGRPWQILGSTEDITERKRAEEALRNSERLLQAAQQAGGVGAYVWDIVEDSWWASAELDGIFGAPGDYPRTLQTWAEIVAPDWRERMQSYVQNILEHHLPFDLDYAIQRISDGQRRWVHGRGEIERDAQDKPLRMIGVIQDITERKEAEEALRTSEEKFSRIFHESPDAVAITRVRDGAYLAVNPGFERMSGYSLEEILGKTASSTDLDIWVDPRDRMRWLHELEVNHEVIDMEFRFRTKSGDIGFGSLSTRPAEIGGEPCWISIIRDIAERVRMEEALKVREERFRTLVENTADTIMRFDREGRHLYVNPAVSRITPLKPEDFLWKTHREMGFPESLCTQWESGIQSVFETGQPIETEFELGEGPGVKIIDWRLFPERGPDGRVATVLSIARDLTEARRSQKNYRMLFDQMLDGFAVHEIICDAGGRPVDYRFVSVNPAFETMTGLVAEAVVGRTVREILPDIEPQWIETYGRVALTGDPVRFEQYSAPLGRHYHVVAFRPQTGQFACIMMDVTERVRAEALVQGMNEELEQRVKDRTAQLEAANRELESFSYSVSHDLRAPLRGIDGFSQALIEDYGDRLDEEARHYLARIRTGTQRMGQLIDDLLKLSRITRGELEKQDTDLSAIALLVIRELKQAHPGRKVKVVVQENMRASGDPRLIRVVLENLLGNAWKFTSKTENPRIEIGRVSDAPEPAFFIRDNGAGFSMEYAERLFTAFQRLHSSSDYEGSGIGLAIVHRIIHHHGGRVWAEGEEGRGATFFFTLPA